MTEHVHTSKYAHKVCACFYHKLQYKHSLSSSSYEDLKGSEKIYILENDLNIHLSWQVHHSMLQVMSYFRCDVCWLTTCFTNYFAHFNSCCCEFKHFRFSSFFFIKFLLENAFEISLVLVCSLVLASQRGEIC